MTGDQVRVVLIATVADLAAAADELGALDANVGDGDLGFTVGGSCRAAAQALGRLPPETAPTDLVVALAASLGDANPSTLSTLTAAALGSAAGTLEGRTVLDRDAAIAFLEAVAATMARLGRSGPGDKTVLDALLPSIEALRHATEDPLAAMISAASDGIEATRSLAPRRGRASWLADRAVGHPDPGAVAYLRLLESMQRHLDA